MNGSRKIIPCEQIHWTLVPAIKRELALDWIKMGIKQKDIAKMLGTTEAAVSQYAKQKRGKKEILSAEEKTYVQGIAKKRPRCKNLICKVCKWIRKSRGHVVC